MHLEIGFVFLIYSVLRKLSYAITFKVALNIQNIDLNLRLKNTSINLM